MNRAMVVLERQIRKRFGLDAVAVIKVHDRSEMENARSMLGHFGAPFVASLLPKGGVVAVAGGRAMRELVESLSEDQERRLTVVQAMGSIDSSVGPVDAVELARSMATRYGGNFLTLNTPAFVPDKKTRDAFMGLEQVRTVLSTPARSAGGARRHWHVGKLGLCGAGSPERYGLGEDPATRGGGRDLRPILQSRGQGMRSPMAGSRY
jgi:DNA-binding transcriptional regulator LsrR (DeoR family)